MTNEVTYFSPEQLVARWNGSVTTGTLANWRHLKRGPNFTKFGAKVRYSLASVQAYERENTIDATTGDTECQTPAI